MIMAEMKMNTNRDWLLRMADEEANCEVSACGLAHEAGLWDQTRVNELGRLSLAKFLELSRRQLRQSLEELAENAGVNLAELTSIESGKIPVRNPEVLRQIAAALHIAAEPLLELAGFLPVTDKQLGRIAAQFAARLEPVKPLEPAEEQALKWFKEQAFRAR